VVESAYAALLDLGIKMKLSTQERLAAMQVGLAGRVASR
jgi:hypothetical protein